MSRSVWDLRKLQKSLENKAPSSLYLIYGDESYMVGEALSLLKKKAQLGESGDFGFDQFYYPENLAAQVRDAVETLTILSPRRFVIYKIGNGLKEKEWETLFPVLENPVPSSVFVIVAEKVDKRKKYFRLIGEAGTLVELKRPYENQVSSWIDYMAFTHGIELNSGAAGLLQQLVGSNLSEISNEILKLAQYLGEEKRPIREEDVVHIVSRSRVENVFNLTHAIGNKDKAQALTCLANLLDNGQNELAALSLITRHVRILQRIQEGMREGLAGLKLSTKAGVPQYFLQEYIRQSQQWSSGRIHQALLALHETDRAIKSSPLSSHIWLENFIIQTCKNQSDLN